MGNILVYLLSKLVINLEFTTIRFRIPSCSMLNSIMPESLKLASIRPREDAFTVFHIISIPTNVSTSVWPDVLSSAAHFIITPLTIIDSAIRPLVDTMAFNGIHPKLAFKDTSVAPNEFSESVFSSIGVLAVVDASIFPVLAAVAVLLIVFPPSFL